jgi:transaldolase
MYVEELIGAETVNTMPEETIRAFQDHGTVAPTLESGVDEAKRVLEQLAHVGVDYDGVTKTLEKEGTLGRAQQLEQLGFLHISIQQPLGLGFESTIKLHP